MTRDKKHKALERYLVGNKKRHKYGAKKTSVDGITFDSKAEAKRYGELLLLQKAEEIVDLSMQPEFVLHVRGVRIGKCILDFKYVDYRLQKTVYEDVKGFDNPLSKWKRKHVEAEYGIKVTILTR